MPFKPSTSHSMQTGTNRRLANHSRHCKTTAKAGALKVTTCNSNQHRMKYTTPQASRCSYTQATSTRSAVQSSCMILHISHATLGLIVRRMVDTRRYFCLITHIVMVTSSQTPHAHGQNQEDQESWRCSRRSSRRASRRAALADVSSMPHHQLPTYSATDSYVAVCAIPLKHLSLWYTLSGIVCLCNARTTAHALLNPAEKATPSLTKSIR